MKKIIKTEKCGNWNPFGVYLTSGNGEDDKPDCALCFYAFRRRIEIKLPPLIRPLERRVIPNWDAATVARLGRDYYIDYTKREYGFLLSDGGFLSVYLGLHTNDSSTDRAWHCHLPWTQWRFVRHSFYGLQGEHLWTQWERERIRGTHYYDAMRAAEAMTPKRAFAFKDFDGEQIKATTHIEEREWWFGEKWFRWLCLFRKPKIRRSLAIAFSAETGKRKGSWKGGTLGHGIEMLPGELHDDAFRRYCAEHQMQFIGPA